jgi:aspartyl-tRNA synthetase
MEDVSDIFRGSNFKVFARLLEDRKNEVWAIPAKGGGSRTFADRMNSWAQGEGQPGLGYVFWRAKSGLKPDTAHAEIMSSLSAEEVAEVRARARRQTPAEIGTELSDYDGHAVLLREHALRKQGRLAEASDLFRRYFEGAGPIASNLGPLRVDAVRAQLGLSSGDACFFVAGDPGTMARFAGIARTKLGEELKLIRDDRFEFAWIVDFPMYEWNDEEKKVDFSHNPFSMPQGGLEALNAGDPLAIKAFQYDLACNGNELASGGIRNHRPEAMLKAFAIAGYGEEAVVERFGGMFRAFHYGAPPHGGMAAGLDRIVMLLAREHNLREVALFPMTQRAEDVLMGAPSPATPRQLRELHIRLSVPEPRPA